MERRTNRTIIETTRRLIAVRRTIRAYRAGNRNTVIKIRFILNPYDANLDLAESKDDRKLFQETCKGLEGSDKFSGKKTTYNDFATLLGKFFGNVRVMETLMILTI